MHREPSQDPMERSSAVLHRYELRARLGTHGLLLCMDLKWRVAHERYLLCLCFPMDKTIYTLRIFTLGIAAVRFIYR